MAAAEDDGQFASLAIRFDGLGRTVWGRYVARDRAMLRSGWIHSPNGDGRYRIERLVAGGENRIKGIIYSPGCALHTFDIPLADVKAYRYSCVCEPVAQIELHGSIPPMGRLYEHEVRIEAKYVAHWAAGFFGYDDGTDTEIPVGDTATLDERNEFHLRIPHLPQDEGEIRIWVRDQVSGLIVDQWRLAPDNSKVAATRLGGIPIDSLERNSRMLTFCPAKSGHAHDEFGFVLRYDGAGVCQP